MPLTAAVFIGLTLLLVLSGVGMGTFASPNTASIMNSVPPEHRGASSGMRATFVNVGNTLGLTLIFTLVIIGLSSSLPSSLYAHLTSAGLPSRAATTIAGIPPVGALFAAYLGYDPMAHPVVR
jgi:MFS family permease